MFNIRIILQYINNNILSKKEFAKLSNISRSTLYNLLNNNNNITLNTIVKIAKTTNIPIKNLVKK